MSYYQVLAICRWLQIVGEAWPLHHCVWSYHLIAFTAKQANYTVHTYLCVSAPIPLHRVVKENVCLGSYDSTPMEVNERLWYAREGLRERSLPITSCITRMAPGIRLGVKLNGRCHKATKQWSHSAIGVSFKWMQTRYFWFSTFASMCSILALLPLRSPPHKSKSPSVTLKHGHCVVFYEWWSC